jgi:hypothetical protein
VEIKRVSEWEEGWVEENEKNYAEIARRWVMYLLTSSNDNIVC